MTQFGYFTGLYLLSFAGFMFFAATMLGTAAVAFGLSQVCAITAVASWLAARREWKNRNAGRKL